MGKLKFVAIGLLISVFLVFLIWSIFKTPESNFEIESKEQITCMVAAKNEWLQFWSNFEKNKLDIDAVSAINDQYQLQKENCYRSYSPYFLLYGQTMTAREVSENIQKLDGSYKSEAERMFESLPPSLQIRFYKRQYGL